MIADIAVVMSLLMITSGLAVTRSPADTDAFPAFLASNCSLIVMGMEVPLLVSDNDTFVVDRMEKGACLRFSHSGQERHVLKSPRRPSTRRSPRLDSQAYGESGVY